MLAVLESWNAAATGWLHVAMKVENRKRVEVLMLALNGTLAGDKMNSTARIATPLDVHGLLVF